MLMALSVAAVVSGLVIARAVLTPDGYLSPDSMNYLALATNLGRGLGFQVANEGYYPAGLQPFADWPVGYPAAIHLVATATGTTPFWASKLLNVVLLLLCTGMLGATCGRTGAIVALPFAFASNLEIFSYTWSEGPFIFLLLAAAMLLAGLIDKPGKGDAWRSLLLAACCVGLFLVRYVGAFSVALPGIVVIVSLRRRNYRTAWLNGLLLIAAAGFIWLYLSRNAALTGYPTGMPRIPPTDSPAARLAMLAGAIWSELILPLAIFADAGPLGWPIAALEGAGLAATVIAVRHRYLRPLRDLRIDRAALCCGLVGSLYLAAIIILRWRNEFDPYNFRLLGPGTVLLVIAGLRVALTSWPAATRAIGAFAVAMAAGSVGLAAVDLPRPSAPGYAATVRSIGQRYAAMPPGAVIVFGNPHLRYLRPDLFIAMPLCRPWFDEDESWDEFLADIDRRRPVYVDMTGPALAAAGCQPSVRAFLATHHAGELFRL